MPDESIEQKKTETGASQPTERREHSDRGSRSGEHRHGHRHRRRRRHKESQPKSKIALIAFAGLVVVLGGGLFFAFGSRAAHKIKASVTRQMDQGRKFVAFGRQTVIIMNPTDEDWAYTTVTVNGQYVAHCPEIPKGTQFEIWFKNLRGPKGEFDSKAEKVQSVKIEPEGKKPIEWTPPIE